MYRVKGWGVAGLVDAAACGSITFKCPVVQNATLTRPRYLELVRDGDWANNSIDDPGVDLGWLSIEHACILSSFCPLPFLPPRWPSRQAQLVIYLILETLGVRKIQSARF